jgi:transaldolase
MNRIKALTESGQAVWLDYIRRDLLEDGTLAGLVRDDGVTGVTSNPAIFQQAIGESELYDDQIREIISADPGVSTDDLYERLAVADIRAAADILRPAYDSSGGADGYVSLEVSPHLARDADETVAEAHRFWNLVDRPNLMIKVPATAECMPAIEQLLADGINVNITLMFSLGHYEDVARAYLRGLERCSQPQSVASVASFFVSRVDSSVDKRLEAVGSERALSLRGTIAVANSKVTYQRFLEIFHGEEFSGLEARGAGRQRVLWASTSTKNPDYRDVLYVEELVGPETVNTVPPATIEAFRDHGEVAETLTSGLDEARGSLASLESLGISLDEVTEDLQREGLQKFSEPFDRLLEALDEKRHRLAEVVSG